MATEREEDLLCLIEIVTKEMFSMAVECGCVRYDAQSRLRRFASEEDVEFEDLLESGIFNGYDQGLEKAVDRLLNVICLAEERVQELSPPQCM